MLLSTIFNKIKGIFSTKLTAEQLKYNDFIEKILPSLKFGDIIYAERFVNDIEKEYMGEGHTTGPFVVISFDEDKIIGAYCTSSEKVKGGFELGEGYSLFNRNKKTYATVSSLKTIDSVAYLGKAKQGLNNHDINKLKKKLSLTNKIKYNDFGLIKYLDIDENINYDQGDIVSHNGNANIIVEKLDDSKFIIIPINKYNSHHGYIDFTKVRIDYSNAKEIERNNLYYLNTINHSQRIVITNNYNDYKKRKDEILNNKQNKLDRGCLINVFNQLYYVYGIEGNFAQTFCVKKNSSAENTILITGKTFMPFYKDTKNINIKQDTYRIIGVASESEMDKIKEARKNYKKNKKIQDTRRKINIIKKANKNGLSIGTIVCLINDPTSKYIISSEEDNTYSLISLYSLLSEHKIVTINYPKESVKKTNNITKMELQIIKKNLSELDNKELPKEVTKVLTINDSKIK